MPPSLDRIDQLDALIDSRTLQLEAVMREVVAEATRVLGADRGTLYLVDRAQGELVSRVAHLPELDEIRLQMGEGVAGWVAQTGGVLNVPRGTRDARFSPRIDRETGYHTRSLLAVPIRDNDHPRAVLGVLQLLNKRGEPDAAHPIAVFSQEDEATLQHIADRVSTLLARSSLGSQLRGHPAAPLSFHFNHIIGDCPAMTEVYRRVERAAKTMATVLIRGESGTGKELVARAVHDNSPRADQPFVVVDLAAIPPDLIENELFGHVRGAFTGAHRDAPGRVQEAEGGTLFLDELGELPLALQSRLLRLIQERTYSPVGSSRRCTADVRFVCATHRPLEAMVRAGEFREDLYYRVRVVELSVPPLRDRGAVDLDRLVDHFLYTFAQAHGRPDTRIHPTARARLHAHPWPGNVRELRHAIESAVVLGESSPLRAEAFGSLGELAAGPTRPAPGQPTREDALPDAFFTKLRPLRDVEADYVRWALARCGGNQSQAARQLGIGRNTLARKLKP